MRHFLLLGLILLVNAFAFAQTPPGIPYQAIARNTNGTPYTNSSLSVRFSLHEQTATGTVSYSESHSLQTNELGLFSTTFGSGTPITGTFAAIDWAQTTKFLQVEINLGSAWVDLGTQQLMSVPYAMYAGNASLVNGIAINSHYLGEYFGGGVIFHLWRDDSGVEHGLIVATSDISPTAEWSNLSLSLIGSGAQSTWDGLTNCNAIIAQSGHLNSAAKLCLDFISNDQNDWYLPSISELNLLFNNFFIVNKKLSIIQGAIEMKLSSNYYSSTEKSADKVWGIGNFGNVTYSIMGLSKTNSSSTTAIRPIRSF